jgi:outer membrane protein OmpA-like peptidoglycan-associated protein
MGIFSRKRYWRIGVSAPVYVCAICILIPLLASSFASHNHIVPAHRGRQNDELQRGMYVVVGAFQVPENAIRYAASIQMNGEKAAFGRNDKTGLYYVFFHYSPDDLDYVRSRRTELRNTQQFRDAWILYVGLNLEDLLEKKDAPAPIVQEMPVEQEPEAPIAPVVEVAPTPEPVVQEIQSRYDYRFVATNAVTGDDISGTVEIIDAARNNTMQKVTTSEVHSLATPSTQTREIIVRCNILGFKPAEVQMKINDPMASENRSQITQSNGITTVQISLSPIDVGDEFTMQDVYFFNDAAIMRPESKPELDKLLEMMQNNQQLEIIVHGHTNGNARGKIVTLSEGDENYFELSSNNEEGFGSAKKLSEERANAIARWLKDHGIAETRIAVKGWGGKKMLHPSNSKLASKNARVVVEIVKS